MITIGNTSIQISLILTFVTLSIASVLQFVAVVWFVVQGFRVHWGWGVANLLIPGAIIPFCFLHFKESKKPLILFGIAVALVVVLLVCLSL
jgi:hypothetical protein